MTSHKKRILILGTTGVDKSQAVANLLKALPREEKWKSIQFEQEYLFNEEYGGISRTEFLDAPLIKQGPRWKSAWKAFVDNNKNLISEKEQGIVLCMHASYIRGHYGVRSVLNPAAVAEDFKPDLIVTLISDVYDLWWRIENRANHDAVHGRPSLEHLLFGRRHEILVGDMIASVCNPKRVMNYMLATAHPIEALQHLVQAQKPRIVYLSFPISEPRRMLSNEKDESGIEEVSQFIASAYELQKQNSEMVLLCPLAIDELPLTQIVKVPLRELHQATPDEGWPELDEDGEKIEYLSFPREKHRWPLSRLYPLDNYITHRAKEPQIAFPAKQLDVASGIIFSDVTFRDFRYVEQADCTCVYNPIFRATRKNMSRSVREEINYASSLKRRVFIYQDIDRDPNGIIDNAFGSPGTMASGPSGLRVSKCSSLEDLLSKITTYHVD